HRGGRVYQEVRMSPRRLRLEEMGIEGLWDEGCYTEALLLYSKTASELAPRFTALVDRAEQTRLGQLQVWRKETIAQAYVAMCDYLLDRTTGDFHRVLVRLLEDQGAEDPAQ